MYKVKVDEKLLCFTGSVNGMEYVTDPDVKLVVNGVDSFSFAIYPQHPLYKEIECKVSRVKIWRDSKLLFYGEVTGYSQDMYGIRTYDCEGALSWLNDLHFAYAISGATPKEVLYWYIKLYNQKLRDKSKSFELGTVTIHKALTQSGTESTIARSSGVYPSFWEEIQDKLLDSFGGILRVRYVGSDTCAGYIDWLAIPDGTCSQDVRYAKNLLNCDWTYDCTALATAVVPLGKRKDSSGDNEVRLTIDKADDDDATFMIQYMTGTDDLVKSGNMVYSKSRMEKYGLIQQAVTFDDITDAGTLAYQGAVWLRQNGKAASTIRAEAIDLADIDESVEHFTHGDYVRTKLPGDSAESLFPITAIEIPIAAPENAKLTVGTQESGITSGSGGQGGGSIADAGSGADAMAHTHSNKGVLDKITEQDYADFKGAVNKAHVHANKDTLDKIDETAWLTVYGQAHKHDNKDVLDQITQTEWNAINSAKNKAHTHDNKKTLDKIDDVSWLTVYGQTHEHSNKAVLDKLTAQDYSDFKGTVNKAHVHSNKDTLDKIDETSWLLVYGQTHVHENQSVLDKTTASYTTAEQTKLKGVSAGAEVNQNAFSTIATGSARYAATAKQSAFLIDGDGGTSVSLDTKTGRLTVSSHTHDNKAVLDQLSEEQWKFINGAANKAHVHDNKGTLDKITDVGWNTVYGNTHSHENTLLDVKNYTNYALGKSATASAASKLSTARKINTIPFDGTKDITIPRSRSLVHQATGTNRSTGYVAVATFTIAGIYTNLPGFIRYRNRGRAIVDLSFRFKNANSRDPELDFARMDFDVNAAQRAYLSKSGTGTWVLYIEKSEAYDEIEIMDCQPPTGIDITFTNAHASSLPSGTVAFTQHNRANESSTVANATTWNGLINDVDTYNSSDTWILVKKDNRIQHRYAGELDVNSAKTLVDSGWQKPTFPSGVKSSSIRYRKQGKIVSVTGYVQFSTAQTTITVFTLPTGYRPPAKIQQFNAVDSSAQASFLTKIDTDGKVGFFGKTQGFFTTATEYYMHCTFFVD